MTTNFLELLALDGNGAVEASLPEGIPLRAVLIGPIKTWWGRMDSEEYRIYSAWREAVRVVLIENGCLVYAPHRAWSGAWHESAQLVNDEAIAQSDFVIHVTPCNVDAKGTEEEIAVARSYGKPVLHYPPATDEHLLQLKDEIALLVSRSD